MQPSYDRGINYGFGLSDENEIQFAAGYEGKVSLIRACILRRGEIFGYNSFFEALNQRDRSPE